MSSSSNVTVSALSSGPVEPAPYVGGMERLIEVVQELSLARDLERVMHIVRRAARELTGADGATFILRDGDFCHYADEDAIAPLWKNQRFPIERCVSGWAMLNRQPAIIEDIYQDDRIPADAYRPTFVRSLVVVPIRTAAPVGAIGNYWARRRRATPDEVRLLAALADSTSIAIENVQLYRTLESRVEQRTAELAASRQELARKNDALVRAQQQREEMAALLVHDLKSPASGIMLSCKARLRRPDLSDSDRQYWKRVFAGAEVINRMALNLLDVTRGDDGVFRPRLEDVDLDAMLGEVVDVMTPLAVGREQRLELERPPGPAAVRADRELLRRVLQNLIDNALRYNPADGVVRLGAAPVEGGIEIRVADEGPGIPEAMRQRIFEKYTRLEQSDDAAVSVGRGLGLAFCRLAVQGHGGSVWVEPNRPRGSVFVVRLPAA